jgi:hypothetical protein
MRLKEIQQIDHIRECPWAEQPEHGRLAGHARGKREGMFEASDRTREVRLENVIQDHP